jgi:hypothetical protein
MDIYKEKEKNCKKLPLPVGVEEYVASITEYYYVDKTLLIKEILDQESLVTLFTRPRLFGKSLNMDMLKVFFEKTNEDTSVYFKDKKIWACGKEYQEHQGKYPVIFISFKDTKYENWKEAYDSICDVIIEECLRHEYLLDSTKLTEREKNLLRKY